MCFGLALSHEMSVTCVCVCVFRADMQSDEGTEWLMELLTDVQLQQYYLRIRDDLNVTRLFHFDYVKTEDLEKIGMGRPGGQGVGTSHTHHTHHTHVIHMSPTHRCSACNKWFNN